MKKRLFILTGLALSFSAAAQDMYLEYKMSGPVSGTSRMYTSAAGVRIEADLNMPQNGPMKNVTLMPARQPGTVITFNDRSKTYTETNTKAAAESSRFDVNVVGKEKVGAFNCVHSTLSLNGKPAMDIWTSKDIAGYEALMKLARANSPLGSEDMYRQLESKGAAGMMVKMISNAGRGLTTELVKAERRSNAASLFTVPVGYTKSSFDPAKLEKMTPAERQKAMQEMMKQYGGKPQKP